MTLLAIALLLALSLGLALLALTERFRSPRRFVGWSLLDQAAGLTALIVYSLSFLVTALLVLVDYADR